MRFLEITFRCFGPFEERPFDFTKAKGLQVIHGLNEAGKSSSLRGIHALLYGFPGQSGDDFRFKYNQFRVHARLENKDGKSLECIRRKGNKDTLRKSDDKTVIAEREMIEFLGGLDETRFKQFFGLDASRLLAGSDEIAQGKGDVGGPLFEAGAGLRGLRALSTRLEEQQAVLCKSTMRTGEIPTLKGEFQSHVDRIRECLLPPETYAEAVSAAEKTEEHAKALRDQRLKARAQHAQLTRYRAALPTIEQLEAAKKELQPLEQYSVLPTEFDELHRKLISDRLLARSGLTEAQNKLAELRSQLGESATADAILIFEDEIRQLGKLFGADQKQREERRQAETFRISEEGIARDIYRELTGSKNWDEMAGWKLRLEEREHIVELANRHSAVVLAVERESETVADLRADLAGLREELNKSEPVADGSAWEALVASIVKLGPLEQNATKQKQELAQSATRLENEFRQFNPVVPGVWENVPELRIPSREEIEASSVELKSAKEVLANANKQLQQIESEIDSQNNQLVQVEAGQSVPTFESLATARTDRDGGMLLVRRRLDGQTASADESSFIARHAPGRQVVDAAEASIRDCDTIADRLLIEADRVARVDSIRKQLVLLQERQRKQLYQVQQASDAVANVQSCWVAIWSESGIAPRTPDIMLAWLTRWHDWSLRRAEYRRSLGVNDREWDRINGLREQVVVECALEGEFATLAEAIDRAQSKINRTRESKSEVKRLRDAIDRTNDDIAKAERRLSQATSTQEKWVGDWAAAVASLRLSDPNPSVSTVQNYVQQQEKMHDLLKDARIKAARVREIDAERVKLITRLNAVRQGIDSAARATTEETLEADHRDLEVRLQKARDFRTRRDEVTKQIGVEEKKEAKEKSSFDKAEAHLEALRVQAGVAIIDELPDAIQRARKRSEVGKRVAELEQILSKNLIGESMVELIAAAREHANGIEEKLLELEEAQRRLDNEISTAESLAKDAKSDLDKYQRASDDAAAAHQQAALVGSRLQDRVIEFAAIHLARMAIEKAKEQYRQKNQDNMLTKAGSCFKTLTDGAFAGLDIDNEEGKDVLKAVRSEDSRADSRVSVDGLSDGTRDQLFLALRLAGIDNHLAERGPFPLIVDDALINFDDKRTRSTLACLAELAKKTQVLIFTHHRHVVQFAREVDSDAGIHELC
ncbi:MAG TPA: AAA family ATPase [Gemmataceae bacterium]|nr:AAA family ATPase [Gemmataceae bacterium]